MKKLICLAMALALLAIAGCSGEVESDEPVSTTEITTVQLPIEPTQHPISLARLAVLKSFLSTHEQTMLELAELLLEKVPPKSYAGIQDDGSFYIGSKEDLPI